MVRADSILLLFESLPSVKVPDVVPSFVEMFRYRVGFKRTRKRHRNRFRFRFSVRRRERCIKMGDDVWVT